MHIHTYIYYVFPLEYQSVKIREGNLSRNQQIEVMC